MVFTATVVKVFDYTSMPVLLVRFEAPKGRRQEAVLKIYDRRFSKTIRRMENKDIPHTPAAEASFQSFVRSGEAIRFWKERLDGREYDSRSLATAVFYLCSKNFAGHGPARCETAFEYATLEYFCSELRAYNRLIKDQGLTIPRPYATVTVLDSTGDTPNKPNMKNILIIRGLMMQYIPGYSLFELPTSIWAPTDPKECEKVVQLAVDAAHNANMRGVIIKSFNSRSVIVDGDTQRPFLTGFTQCCFNEDQEKEHKEGRKFNGQYLRKVWDADNPGKLGSVMKARIEELKNVKLDVRWPEWHDLKFKYPR